MDINEKVTNNKWAVLAFRIFEVTVLVLFVILIEWMFVNYKPWRAVLNKFSESARCDQYSKRCNYPREAGHCECNLAGCKYYIEEMPHFDSRDLGEGEYLPIKCVPLNSTENPGYKYFFPVSR